MSDRVERNKSTYSRVLTTISTLLRNACMVLMAALITSVFTSALNAAELVVIASSGGDFKVGQVVDSSSDIKLINDITLTLISESGKVFALKGPRSGAVEVDGSADKNSGLIPSIKNILTGEKTEASTLGVMRSIGAPKLPSDPWAIIANKTGKYCVTLSKPVVLWRADSKKTRSLILINIDNNHKVKTVWGSGQNILYWPRLMPLVDDATYRVDLAGESKLPKLTVAMVPDQPTQAHAAVWMSQNGCEQQALRLIQSIN